MKEELLEPPFRACVLYPSAEFDSVNERLAQIAGRNSDIVFDDLFDPSRTNQLDADLFRARMAGAPVKFPEGQDFRTLEMCIDRVNANEGVVAVFGDSDSSGTDLLQAYAVLFGKNPITSICLPERYRDHPWIVFHSRDVIGSFEEYENNFRTIVRDSRDNPSSSLNLRMRENTAWINGLLDLPARMIRDNPSFYLGHATTHMKEVRELQLAIGELAKKRFSTNNPYHDLPGTDIDREIEDKRKRGEKLILPPGFDRYIVHKDVTGEKGIAENDGGIFILNWAYTIGREDEIVDSNLSGRQITYGICFDKRLYHHLLLRAHFDHVDLYEGVTNLRDIAPEVTERVLEIIEERKTQGLNQRVEKYREMIRKKLKAA